MAIDRDGHTASHRDEVSSLCTDAATASFSLRGTIDEKDGAGLA